MEISLLSRKLIGRLPVYLNYLQKLPEELEYISATTIAAALGMGHVQVRKDLAKISDSGRSRLGHCRQVLIRDIAHFLNYTSTTGAIVVGTGDLGGVLLDYQGFESAGLSIVAGFDLDPQTAQTHSGKPIYSIRRLESFCNCYQIHFGILAVPPAQAQKVCDQLVACGIQAIWNFTPVQLRVPKDVTVQNENLFFSIASLRTRISGTHSLVHNTAEYATSP